MNSNSIEPIRYFDARMSLPLFAFCGVMVVVLLFALLLGLPRFFALVVLLTLFLALVNFYQLKVFIQGRTVVMQYGLGLIDRAFDITDIESVNTVPNESILAWMYNPLGTEIVEVITRDKRSFAIPCVNSKEFVHCLRPPITSLRPA